jgi:isopentenyl phosphate kinase
LIIIHGGGSFGHPLAKQYKIKEGYEDPSQIEGFSKTHQAMLELNKLVVDALIHHNIPAFSVSPSSCIVTKASRIQIFYDSILTRLLKTGFVPVLFGDAVLDNSTGFTILSGDQLITALAIRFKADKIVLGVDVDGLYTADPKTNACARLMSHITLQDLKTRHNIEEAKVTDVTGGMLGKISELIPAINADIRTFIVNASKEGNVYKVLKGEKMTGTLIEKE